MSYKQTILDTATKVVVDLNNHTNLFKQNPKGQSLIEDLAIFNYYPIIKVKPSQLVRREVRVTDHMLKHYDSIVVTVDTTSKIELLKTMKKLERKYKSYAKLGMDDTDPEMAKIIKTIVGVAHVITTV